MSFTPNPFTNRGAITNPDDFFGRTEQLSEILTRLQRLQSSSIVGERRIGKSSLLYYLANTGATQLNDPRYRFFYVDMQNARFFTVNGFFRYVLKNLGVNDAVIKDDHKPDRNLYAFTDELETLANDGQRIVLCLDEFENVFDHPNEFSNDFFDHMRSQLNLSKFALVTVTKTTLRDLYSEGKLTSPFYNVFTVIQLGSFTEEEASGFVEAYHQRIHFTDDELQFIRTYLELHPLKLQILCDWVVKNRQHKLADGALLEEIDKEYSLFFAASSKLSQKIKRPVTRLLGSTPRIAKIELINIRCFKEATINVSPSDSPASWVLFTGDNSAGKTTMLRSIALGLASPSNAAALLQESRMEWVRDGEIAGQISLHFETGDFTKIVISRDSGNNRIYEHTASRDSLWNDTFVCGYGAARRAFGDKSFPDYSILDAVRNLFNYDSQLQNLEVVLRRLLVGTSHKAKDSLLQQIDSLLMLAPGSTRLGPTGLEMGGPWGESTAIRNLGDGYQATISWVVDMLSWAALYDAKMLRRGIQGIVLIDEIEQHLHPQWQRRVLSLLRQQFPGIQFFATTHSPMCIIGTTDFEDEEVCLVHFEQTDHQVKTVQVCKPPRGQRADQVLTSYLFGLETTTDDQTKQEVELLAKLLSRGTNSSEEKQKIDELRQALDQKLGSGETELERQVASNIREALVTSLEQQIKNYTDQSLPEMAIDLETRRQLKALLGEP